MFRHPEYWPFFCIVADKAFRKPMVTRIIESVIIAIGGGYIALAVASARIEEKVAAVERRVDVHIGEEIEGRRQVMDTLREINNCLRNRTCTK